MLTPTPTWTVRGATFALWGLAAASAAFWALKLGGTSAPSRAPLPPSRAMVAVDPGAVARLLGSAPAVASAAAPAPTLASRFQLVGVAAGARSGEGAAVISVDGKPARPYRVGTSLDQGLVLQSVHGRTATIGPTLHAPPVLTLELPPLPSELAGQTVTIPAPRVNVPSRSAPQPAFTPQPVPSPAPAPAAAAAPQQSPDTAATPQKVPMFSPPPGATPPARRQPQPPPIAAPR